MSLTCRKDRKKEFVVTSGCEGRLNTPSPQVQLQSVFGSFDEGFVLDWISVSQVNTLRDVVFKCLIDLYQSGHGIIIFQLKAITQKTVLSKQKF